MSRPLAMAKAHDYPNAAAAIQNAPRGPQPQFPTDNYLALIQFGFTPLQASHLNRAGYGFVAFPEPVER